LYRFTTQNWFSFSLSCAVVGCGVSDNDSCYIALCNSLQNTKKNIKALLIARKAVGVEKNVQKTLICIQVL
jgi:hypothetical protein